MSITIPLTQFDSFVSSTDAALQLVTGIGSITFSSDAVNTLGANEDPNAIVVFYIGTNGELETVTNGHYDSATSIVSGSGGMLSPTATTTRAEMTQVLYNLLGK